MNSDGFHDVGRTNSQKQNAFRIAAVGDSFTAAIHVPVSTTWTQILENRLASNWQIPVEVVNLGIDGTTTDVHANLLSTYSAQNNLDLAILAFNENDLNDLTLKRVYREVHAGYIISFQNEEQKQKAIRFIDDNLPSGLSRSLYDSIFLYRVLCTAFGDNSLLQSNFLQPKQVGIDLLRFDKNEAAGRLARAIDNLLDLAEAKRFTLIIAPIPSRRNANESKEVLLSSLPAELVQRLVIMDLVPTINAILQNEGLEFREMYWRYDGHFNLTGNLVFGRALEEKIDQMFPAGPPKTAHY
jgi:hypothetical protein